MTALRAFSHGPYNPLNYKAYKVPEELPTTEGRYDFINNVNYRFLCEHQDLPLTATTANLQHETLASSQTVRSNSAL